MKTWKRFGYEDDNCLYVGSAEQLEAEDDDFKLRIMMEDDFKKREAERRMYKRVYDAAMAWHNEKPNSNSVKNVIALQKACEKARGRTKR